MKSWIIAVVALLSLAGGPAAAKERVWVSLGGGGAGHSGAGMAGGRLGVHFMKGPGMLTVSLARWEEVQILGTTRPSENVIEGGVLLGQRFGGRVGFVSVGAGLSVLSGVRRGEFIRHTGFIFGTDEYESKPFTTIGLPVNLELGIMPSKVFGLALDGFGTISPEYTLAGATLSLLFGQLR
jgi:hypothetical protein